MAALADGDTITLLKADNHTTKVRLHGIDAPEKAQPFGQVAKKRLSDLVFGKAVTFTVTAKGQDRYGRTLGVMMVNGEDINGQMVRDGLAWAYRKYSQGWH